MNNTKLEIKVKDIMAIEPECINTEATIKDASIKMKGINAGFLPVCENDKLIGVVTDRDIVVRGVAQDKGLNTNIKDVMTTKVIYCFDEDNVEGIANIMAENHVRRLAVLNQDKRLVGVLSIDDIATKAGINILKAENLNVNKPM